MRGFLALVASVAVLAAHALAAVEVAASPDSSAAGGDRSNPASSADYLMPSNSAHDPSRATGIAEGSFTFTFDSPDHPWSPEDLSELVDWTGPGSSYLSTLLEVAGPPPRDVTINVRRDPRLTSAGQYRVGLMTLRELELDVFMHEMSHAVHDSRMLSNEVWEEGLARATESQVLWALEEQGIDIEDGDPHYDYPYDRYHDLTNTPDLGVQGGSIWGYGNRAMSLVRYENAGYAFGKALIEDPTFVRRFNLGLFQHHPDGWVPESELVALAAEVKPAVEGVPFAEWHRQQGIFESNPPKGCRLFQRINQWTVDFFCRSSSGLESSQAAALVQLRGYDADGGLLFEDEGVTSPLGWADFSPSFEGYAGRVKVVATADSPAGTVSSTFYRQASAERGVFGVVTNATVGTVTLDSPDGRFPSQTVPVEDGAFVAENLKTFRGSVRLTYTGPQGTASRQITKAASPYGVSLTVLDVSPPQTRIRSGPKNGTFALARSARFVFSANESPATFGCWLDGEVIACSKQSLKLRRLSESTHTFEVAGTDSAGNRDLSPALRRWTVPINDTRLRARGTWVRRSGRAYYQHSHSQTRARGAQLSRRVSGVRKIVLVAARGPGHGAVHVFLDGQPLKRVNLSHSEPQTRQIIGVAEFSRPRAGRVRVVVKSRGKPVRIEGLGIETR